MKLTLNNPPKALIVLVGLVCITVMMVLDSIDKATGAGMIGTIIGYAVGNGIAAKAGQAVEPIVGGKRKDDDDPEPAALPAPSGWSPQQG